jgi:hypothetical protein
MARLFVTDINLNKNELQNARIQGLSSAPSSAVTGQIYYDTSNNTMYYNNGLTGVDGPWMPMGASSEVITDVIKDAVIGGVGLTATPSDVNNNVTIDLDNTAVTPGSYGSATAIPTFTVDAQGRLTAAGTVNVATQLDLGADNAHGGYKLDLLTDSVKFVGGEGIDTTYATDGTLHTITIAGEDATTTNKGIASFADADFTVSSGAVSIKNVNLGTQTTGDYVANIQGTTNEITVSPTSGEGTTVTIGLPDDVTITNNLNVGGDLNVTGSINTVNVTQVNITDNKINLNADMPEENAPSADAGIIVHRGTEADAELLWNESTDRWQLGLVSGNYHDIARKYVTTIGDGSALTYTVTHNLGTREVSVQVYDTATYATVETDVTRTSTSQVVIGFAVTAPAAGAYTVVIVG